MSLFGPIDAPPRHEDSLGFRSSTRWKEFLFLTVFYVGCAAIATFPRIARLDSTLPTLADPVQHLTVMRWYRSCLVEGRSPFRLAGLQHPVGATLGAFSPMLAQSALFIPLSFLIKNDCLIYNILWFFGLWITGMGSYWLISRFVDDRLAAAIGGLGVLLCGPVIAHAHGHLELIYLGAVAIFWGRWIEFVEKPSRKSLATAVGCYWLAAACAAYNAVLCIAPAAWFVFIWTISTGPAGIGKRIKSRLLWLLGFAAFSLPGILLLFAGPLWSLWNGVTMSRSLAEFRRYGAPVWSYVAPPKQHAISKSLGVDFYDLLEYSWVESEAYLGIVALLLFSWAIVARPRFRRAGYWWSCLILLVILSFGVELKLGTLTLPMPGYWLWKILPIFRLIRVPARFNLLACLAAGVIVSASARDVFARLRTRRNRLILASLAVVAMLADLGTFNFASDPLPKMPRCYEAILKSYKNPRFLEVPVFGSGVSEPLTSCEGYWQGFHRARTSGGYSGVSNDGFDARIGYNSPVDGVALSRKSYLNNPEHVNLGVVEDVDARDALWLYSRANDFSHIVFHHWIGFGGEVAPGVGRWEKLLADAKVFEDADATVFETDRLRAPIRPVLAPGSGWVGAWPYWKKMFTRDRGEWALCNPRPSRLARLVVRAKGFRGDCVVRLTRDGRELARWRVFEGKIGDLESPPLSLSGNVDRVVFEVSHAESQGILEVVGARLDLLEDSLTTPR